MFHMHVVQWVCSWFLPKKTTDRFAYMFHVHVVQWVCYWFLTTLLFWKGRKKLEKHWQSVAVDGVHHGEKQYPNVGTAAAHIVVTERSEFQYVLYNILDVHCRWSWGLDSLARRRRGCLHRWQRKIRWRNPKGTLWIRGKGNDVLVLPKATKSLRLSHGNKALPRKQLQIPFLLVRKLPKWQSSTSSQDAPQKEEAPSKVSCIEEEKPSDVDLLRSREDYDCIAVMSHVN